MTQSVRYQMQRKSEPERYQSDKHLWWLKFKNFSGIPYVMLLGLKNDDNGVMRGPYLSRNDKDHRTPENCSYPQQNSKS